MGTPGARITAADFHTPPELKQRRLAAHAAGRIGGARLALAAGPDGTSLHNCYQQVPVRVLPPFRFGPGRPSLLYLLNPTAGLLDGDAQRVQLSAGPNSRAVVVGQSATRIHPCLRGFSTQQWDIRVEPGAVLVVLPGPAIPFHGCRYYQRVTVELAEGAGFLWGDVWLAGRYARGDDSELFQFETLIQDLTVQRKGRPIFRDRFCWQGPWDRTSATWHFGDHPACGSLFVTGTAEAWEGKAAGVLEEATFATASGDTCFRWQGEAEAVVAALVSTALHSAGRLANEPAPWLLASHELAPNHWFSPAAVGR